MFPTNQGINQRNYCCCLRSEADLETGFAQLPSDAAPGTRAVSGGTGWRKVLREAKYQTGFLPTFSSDIVFRHSNWTFPMESSKLSIIAFLSWISEIIFFSDSIFEHLFARVFPNWKIEYCSFNVFSKLVRDQTL